MFSDDGSAGRSAGHFILQQTHSTRDHLSLAAGKSGSTPSRDCHVRDQVPPDGEGGRLVAFKLREASACRAPGNDCRHESIYAAPSFSRPYGDESAAISKAASPACRTATHTHGWTGRGKCGVRGRLRKPEPIQSRVQAILWPAPNSRYQGPARRQSRGDHYRLTLNCWVAMGAVCSRPSQTGLRALALVKSLEDDLDRISKVGPEKRPSRKPADQLPACRQSGSYPETGFR